MKPLLIEIGSEEIPARFVSVGLRLLKESLTQHLDKCSLEYGEIHEYGTPRRLTVAIADVQEHQEDRTVETLGPPKKVAFDTSGNPTKAAIGFASSTGIDVGDLKIMKTDRGEYVYALVEEKGRTAGDLLAESLPELISSLQLPKSMRWGGGSVRYFRPIQWILALFGGEVVPFDLDGIGSGRISYGHRFLSPGKIEIPDSASYLSLLRERMVFADIRERRERIMEGIRDTEASSACVVHKDDELLDTVTNLVEYPNTVLGSFDDKYLSLPRELLITVMKAHQKYFSVEDTSGAMSPYFVVVSNTKADNNDTVKKGAERVLRARLDDARFYYSEDTKIPIWNYVGELKKVTFQEQLGSLYRKAERMASICSFIAEKVDYASVEKLQRACMLSKADLVTGVVGEFPELQGYMGMMYALDSKEDREVAEAIYEHYLPKFPGDALPAGEMGILISLADKIDNISSFFFLEQIPTGSEDPYALRRQASGIISILQGRDYPLTLHELIDKAAGLLQDNGEKRDALSGGILRFFYQRLEGMFLSQGYAYDTVNAVLAVKGSHNMKDIRSRLNALSELRTSPDFPGLLMSAKRVYNILAKVKPGEVNRDMLAEPAEKELYGTVDSVGSRLADTHFRALFDIETPVNTFFNDVLVMDPDPGIRGNRLALLASVRNLFDTLGDFSKIVE